LFDRTPILFYLEISIALLTMRTAGITATGPSPLAIVNQSPLPSARPEMVDFGT
jgi:hypothetical protein